MFKIERENTFQEKDLGTERYKRETCTQEFLVVLSEDWLQEKKPSEARKNTLFKFVCIGTMLYNHTENGMLIIFQSPLEVGTHRV